VVADMSSIFGSSGHGTGKYGPSQAKNQRLFKAAV